MKEGTSSAVDNKLIGAFYQIKEKENCKKLFTDPQYKALASRFDALVDPLNVMFNSTDDYTRTQGEQDKFKQTLSNYIADLAGLESLWHTNTASYVKAEILKWQKKVDYIFEQINETASLTSSGMKEMLQGSGLASLMQLEMEYFQKIVEIKEKIKSQQDNLTKLKLYEKVMGLTDKYQSFHSPTATLTDSEAKEFLADYRDLKNVLKQKGGYVISTWANDFNLAITDAFESTVTLIQNEQSFDTSIAPSKREDTRTEKMEEDSLAPKDTMNQSCFDLNDSLIPGASKLNEAKDFLPEKVLEKFYQKRQEAFDADPSAVHYPLQDLKRVYKYDYDKDGFAFLTVDENHYFNEAYTMAKALKKVSKGTNARRNESVIGKFNSHMENLINSISSRRGFIDAWLTTLVSNKNGLEEFFNQLFSTWSRYSTKVPEIMKNVQKKAQEAGGSMTPRVTSNALLAQIQKMKPSTENKKDDKEAGFKDDLNGAVKRCKNRLRKDYYRIVFMHRINRKDVFKEGVLERKIPFFKGKAGQHFKELLKITDIQKPLLQKEDPSIQSLLMQMSVVAGSLKNEKPDVSSKLEDVVTHYSKYNHVLNNSDQLSPEQNLEHFKTFIGDSQVKIKETLESLSTIEDKVKRIQLQRQVVQGFELLANDLNAGIRIKEEGDKKGLESEQKGELKIAILEKGRFVQEIKRPISQAIYPFYTNYLNHSQAFIHALLNAQGHRQRNSKEDKAISNLCHDIILAFNGSASIFEELLKVYQGDQGKLSQDIKEKEALILGLKEFSQFQFKRHNYRAQLNKISKGSKATDQLTTQSLLFKEIKEKKVKDFDDIKLEYQTQEIWSQVNTFFENIVQARVDVKKITNRKQALLPKDLKAYVDATHALAQLQFELGPDVSSEIVQNFKRDIEPSVVAQYKIMREQLSVMQEGDTQALSVLDWKMDVVSDQLKALSLDLILSTHEELMQESTYIRLVKQTERFHQALSSDNELPSQKELVLAHKDFYAFCVEQKNLSYIQVLDRHIWAMLSQWYLHEKVNDRQVWDVQEYAELSALRQLYEEQANRILNQSQEKVRPEVKATSMNLDGHPSKIPQKMIKRIQKLQEGTGGKLPSTDVQNQELSPLPAITWGKNIQSQSPSPSFVQPPIMTDKGQMEDMEDLKQDGVPQLTKKISDLRVG